MSEMVPVVVLVEDDKKLAEMYRERFERDKFIVAIAGDGDEAINVINQESPDIILLDLMLPRKGGLTVLKIIKSLPQTKDIPVIVMTAYPKEEYKNMAIDDGAVEFISKSEIMPGKLVEKVKQMINWKA